MSFALIAFLLIGTEIHEFELDSGLSAEHCAARVDYLNANAKGDIAYQCEVTFAE